MRNFFDMLFFSVVFVLFIFVNAEGDELLTCDRDAYKWNAAIGFQINQHDSALQYISNDNTKLNIYVDKNKVNTSLSPFTLKKNLTDVSSLDLTYLNDDMAGSLQAKKDIKIIFFYIHTILQVPVDISMHTLRLRYSHGLFHPQGWDIGGSTSFQALQFSVSGDLPFIGFQNETFFTVLPSVGAYAKYKSKSALKYSVHVDDVPLLWPKINGNILDINVAAEYQLSPMCSLGLGYSYSIKDVVTHFDNYDANVSYNMHGFIVFAGIYF